MAREAIQSKLLLSDLEPSYDDCGRVCRATGERLKSFCETCEIKRIDDDFRERCKAIFDDIAESSDASIGIAESSERAANQTYSFDSVLSDYYAICSLENTVAENSYKPEWNVLVYRLVDVVRSERRRLARINDWNDRQKPKA